MLLPTEAAAREIVMRYFLRTGDVIERAHPNGDEMVIEASEWWCVRDAANDNPALANSQYSIYEVGRCIRADPPIVPRGFAVTADGTIYALDDALQFRAFCRRMNTELSPSVLADLLAAYQSDPTPPRRRHHVLVSRYDLKNLLPDEYLEALIGLIPFQAKTNRHDRLGVDFCAYTVERGSMPDTHLIMLDQWHVEVESSGEPTWSRKPLAVGMEW